MNKIMLGRKIGMTQVFTEEGIVIPVTAVEAGPITVIQIKSQERDGYDAVQVGFLNKKPSKTNSPMKGILGKAGADPIKYLREFRVENAAEFEVGKQYTVTDLFSEGNVVDVTGTSKGRGFAGTVKRHHTRRGRETHGSQYHRGPGSMGANSSPSKVFKGKKLPGHMGTDTVTVQNLDIVRVMGEQNVLLVKGAVPGPRGGLLVIREAVKG